MTRRTLLSNRHFVDETGAIAPFVVVFALTLVAIAGLVFDGGATFAARSAALTEAEQAARLGSSTLSTSSLYADQIAPDPSGAIAAAEGFMAASGHPGTAWIDGDTVYARVDYQRPTQFLSLFGIGTMRINESASAVEVHGIVSADR